MSESDEDYCKNATKDLHMMLNNYQADKIETIKLLKNNKTIENPDTSNTSDIISSVGNESCFNDDEILDQIIALNTRRQTRSRGSSSQASKRKSTKGRKRAQVVNTTSNNDSAFNTNEPSLIDITDSPVRGTRARRRSQRVRRIESNRTVYPTISIGNTEEYDDLSENVHMFNNRQTVEIPDDTLNVNEELSVKVYWRSTEIIKFMIRKYQKFMEIFDFFAKRENVSVDKLLFIYDDKILKANDTPDKINYNIVKFIEGGVVDSVPLILDSGSDDERTGIRLKFQCENFKKPFVTVLQRHEKLMQAMVKCAEHFDKQFSSVKFEFDGDSINGAMTPEDLDLEGGECIDVKNIR